MAHLKFIEPPSAVPSTKYGTKTKTWRIQGVHGGVDIGRLARICETSHSKKSQLNSTGKNGGVPKLQSFRTPRTFFSINCTLSQPESQIGSRSALKDYENLRGVRVREVD